MGKALFHYKRQQKNQASDSRSRNNVEAVCDRLNETASVLHVSGA
jgi:hypothetical protein